MPANLTPQYLEAERRFRQATSPDEQLEALEAMMATIPKHKGTEHMRADIRRRMAKIRTEAARSKKAAAKGPTWHHVPREGAGQIALVGAPNAGKSRLLAALTNANPVVAPYPFSTRTPLPGMVPFEDINIQLVDLPPIAPETAEPWLFALIRQADGALLVADLADDDLLASMDIVMALTAEGRVEFASLRGTAGGPEGPMPSAQMPSATLPATMKLNPATTKATPTLLVATKHDAPDAGVRLDLLREAYGARFEILPVSAATGEGLETLKLELFRLLGVIRVYTKAPGRRADKSVPYVFRRGTTVEEVAAVVHKDFAERLKYARVWGSRTYEGQMVQREHVLDDGDVLELHA
ncbi:MAG TPA: GTPase [bacterium]|nr:GTPase [bacterium]